MATPRTHCHFTKQAQAQRVPGLCDDHTPPSCLVTNSLAKQGHRSVNTLVLPDPLLTQEGLVTFLACALHQLFVVRLGTSWPILFTCLCLHTPQLLAASAFSVFGLAVFPCSHGRTSVHAAASWHHRVESLFLYGQLQAGASSPSPVQMSAFTRESHGAAPSSSVSCPQVTLSATHPQVGHLSATLAEAATQLSFAAFLERCILVKCFHAAPATSPPHHLWMLLRRLFHTPLSPRTFLHNSRLRSSLSDLSTRIILEGLGSTFCARCSLPHVFPDPSLRYFLTRLCRHLCTASLLTMPPTQLPLTEFFFGCIFSNDPLDCQSSSSAHENAHSASPSTAR